MTQPLTVNLPSEVFIRIKKRADESNRSVEAEAVELLAATLDTDDELAQSVQALESLDNDGVERAARSQIATELSAELESLHFKKQREGLTEIESARCAELVDAYERSMLIRAHATALLKKRGIDVSHLVAQS